MSVGLAHTGDTKLSIHGPMGGHLDLYGGHEVTHDGQGHVVGYKGKTGVTSTGGADYTDSSGKVHHLGHIDLSHGVD